MIKDLQIKEDKKTLTLDSREVAKMIGKNHADLLRDIRNYISYLGESNFALADFFLEDIYLDLQSKKRPYFKVTKKGCEFIAHKLTGEKGAIFTATYINKFHQMENQLNTPMGELSPQLQLLIQMELKQNQLEAAVTETKEKIADIKENIIADVEDWRAWANQRIKAIGATIGDYRRPRTESYIELEKRARCNLERRLDNKIKIMKQHGANKTAVKNTNYLDVINDDPRLKEIYTSIVKEMSVKHL